MIDDDWLRREIEDMTPEELLEFHGWLSRMSRKLRGVPPGSAVHHINGDIRDNRPENIRIVPISRNRRHA